MPLEAERVFDGETHLVINPLLPAPGTDDGLPIPPKELWEGWGEVLAHYLDSGKDDMAAVLGGLEAAAGQPAGLPRVLDVAWAAGRMPRLFPRLEAVEYWGVDTKARHVAWCQQHLCPPSNFATTTPFSHLPFEDDSFDVVYCGSVFTHMSELADAWLL